MHPTGRLILCAVAWLLLGVAASFFPDILDTAWQVAGFAWAAVAIGDVLWLALMKKVRIERRLPGRMALGVEQPLEITVRNSNVQDVCLRLIDGLPDALRSTDFPWHGRIPGRSLATVFARVRPTGRGRAEFEPACIEHRSPLGLWVRRYRAGLASESVRVYPNYEPVVRFALLAMQHREAQMGIRRLNKPGVSREFHQLRDYHDGDPFNTIDWKATSRRLVLTSREYEEQRNQTIILMADCGRRLRAIDGDLSQFDHCLNAMLLLSFIALRQGDRVGVMAYGGDDRWLPPVTGAGSMPVILNHLYDYQTGSEPGDFSEAAELLLRRQQRRALVVFCTNLRSEDHAQLMRPLQLLRRKHLVIVASLRENEALRRMEAPVETLAGAKSFGAATGYLEDRRILLHSLRRAGILTIDAPAHGLPVALGNLYLDIKKQGML